MKALKLATMLGLFFLLFSACENENSHLKEEPRLITETDNFIKSTINPDEIRLDYHEKYGTIKADEYPMEPRGTEITLETFLEKTDIKKEDIADYRITERRFSGIGLAEHRIDGEVVQVYHKYDNQPVQVLEGTTHDGRRFIVIIIIICSNGLVIVIIL